MRVHAHADTHKWKVLTSVGLVSFIHHALKMPGAPESLGQICVIVAYDSGTVSESHLLPS